MTKQFVTPNRFSYNSPLNLDDRNHDSSKVDVDDPNGDTLNPTESKPPPPIYNIIIEDFKHSALKFKP